MTSELNPDDIQRRMKALRSSLDFDVERVTSSVRAKTDWRYFVSSHPWLTASAVIALGYLIVPPRVEKKVPDTDTLIRLAKEGKLVLAPKGSFDPKAESWSNRLFSVVLAVGTRAAVSYATNLFARAKEKHASNTELETSYVQPQPR